LLAIVAGLGAGSALAEKEDRNRPIQIEADLVRFDDTKKTAMYEGNVILSQGTMSINADRIDIHQDDKGMTLGEATGQPVRFQQKAEGRDEYLDAQANRLEYDARTEVIKLIGGARLKLGGDELRGGVIVYDVRTERYQAEGGVADGRQGRVRAMIQPRKQGDGAADAAPVKP
jgi:lipopolysaccharide export system protein LptA